VPLGFAPTPPVDVHDFDFMFPALQADPDNLLPTSPDTVAQLKALGRTMVDEDVRGEDAPIPAAYTYVGQFVDHDKYAPQSKAGQDLLERFAQDAARVRRRAFLASSAKSLMASRESRY